MPISIKFEPHPYVAGCRIAKVNGFSIINGGDLLHNGDHTMYEIMDPDGEVHTYLAWWQVVNRVENW